MFNNGQQTSPTSTLRYHFNHEHHGIWEHECDRLGVPRKSPTGQALGWDGEVFTWEGFMARLQEFIVGNDLVCPQSIVIFHRLLGYTVDQLG